MHLPNATAAGSSSTCSARQQGVLRSVCGLLCTVLPILNFPFVTCAPLPLPQSSAAPVSASTIQTSYGPAAGVEVGSSVIRHTLPYAQPPVGALRFADPQPLTTLNGYDTTKTPPSCYQGSGDPRGGNAPSEDCLYATYFRPASSDASKAKLPMLVWIHGGSGIGGSSTGAGLDGTRWAADQNVIVVLLQYRLGAFGWLQTGSTLDEGNGGAKGASRVRGNQAMRDVVMALEQIRNVAAAMGGDSSKVTLMGQSSGATMVRALLTTPAAQALFSNAILVSDPQDYGPSSIADNNALGEEAMRQLNCSLSDLACARRADAADVYDATLAAYSTVPAQNPRISSGTPWRPMIGQYIPTSLTSSPQSGAAKPVIMTTVANEAGTAVGFEFASSAAGAAALQYAGGDSHDTATLGEAAAVFFNSGRGDSLAKDARMYPVNATSTDGLRSTLETMATDGLWRCGVQDNAVALAEAGGTVFLAQWLVAAKYPSNAGVDYCQSGGHVCHEDDIYVLFGTTPSAQANAALSSLTKQMQTRFAAFARSGVPAAKGRGNTPWPSVKCSGALNMLTLGEPGDTTATGARSSIVQSQRPAACVNSWGTVVKYDWQLFPA